MKADQQLLGLKRDLAAGTVIAAAVVISISQLIKYFGLYEQIYFSKGLVSAIVFGLSLVLAKSFWVHLRVNKRAALIAFVFSFVLLLAEIAGIGLRLLVNEIPVKITAGSIVWMFLSAFFLSWVTAPCFLGLYRLTMPAMPVKQNRNYPQKVLFFIWLGIFLCYLPCFLAFYPGLYCYDMIWQWQMFATGSFNTHHPLLHTLMSGGLFELGKAVFGSYNAGLALYAFLQLAALAGSAAYALTYLLRIGISKRICVLAAAFYAFFPFFPVSGISTTKDIYFGSLLLIVYVDLCDMSRSQTMYRGFKLARFLIVFILMGLLRNNAVYAVIFTAVCLLVACLYQRLKHRGYRFILQLAGVLLIGVAGIQGSYIMLEKGLDAHQGSVAEMLSIPCQQLARAYVYHGNEMSTEDKEALFRFIPEAALADYKYYVSDPVKAQLNADYLEEHQTEFFQIWADIGRQYPGEYILAPLYNTMGIWYFGGDSSCYVEYHMSSFFDEEHTFQSNSLIPGLKRVYAWFTDSNIQKHLPMVSIIFYTSFYAWMTAGAAAILIQKRQYVYLAPLLLLIAYMLTLLLGPCITVRYMLGIMLCIPVMLAVVAALPERKRRS